MAEKLSWTESRRALSTRADVSEKDANAFLTAFSSQLIEALKSDKLVKINGLGIFKLQAVAPRKSVDVSTGEEIIIEGYNKIVFAPEAGLRELIENAEGLIPIEENEEPKAEEPMDPIRKLGAQAEEIVDILGDLGQSPKTEDPAPKAEEPEVSPEPAPEPEPAPAPAPAPASKPEPTPFVYVPGAPPVKTEKRPPFLLYVIICLLLLLLLLFGAYFFFRSQISNWLGNLLQPKPAVEQVEEAVVPTDTVADYTEESAANTQESLIPEGELSQEQILAEFLLASGDVDELEESSSQELQYAGWITVEPLREGSRLAWVAYRYYGSKVFWPYLYDTNRDRFTNPNIIDAGTPIRIPRLTAAQRDTTNAQTRANLERLRKQAEAQMR